MKNIKFSSSNRFWKSKGFIAALSVCLIAVGAAAWVGLQSASPALNETLTADRSNGAASQPSQSAPLIAAESGSSAAPDETATASPSDRTAPSVSADEPVTGRNEPENSTVAVVTPSASFFVMPITGEILKGYSDSELQYSMTFSDWRLHTGVDIAGSIGDAIHAAGDGVVIAVSQSTAYGKTVEINHGNGIVARYCGLDAVTVKEGDCVKANDSIGTLGEIPCECVEAVHLHFSATKENKTADPLNIMGLDG